MRRIMTIVLVSLVGLAVSASSALADMTIKCPLTRAQRTITNPLPEGWWSTPMVGSLTETRINQLGGRTALYCVYGSIGFVQRYAPSGHICKAVEGGFRCRRPVAQTFSSGQIEVPQTWAFDLDRGVVGRDGSDLSFVAETRDLLYLMPRNGARMAVGDRSNRGHAGCSSARYSSHRALLRDLPVGSYVCVKTGEGRISQFRLNAVSRGTPKTLKIGYTTWR